MTLDESVQEDKDVIEDSGDIKLVYESSIANFLDGKVIDYQDGPRGGFSVNDANPNQQCEGGCC